MKSESKLTPFNILLVDDDELVHMTADLEYAPFTDLSFTSVYSGEEAIKEIQKNPHKYAVILLDFQMGDFFLDGADTTNKILAINPDQFIVICSGDESRETIKKVFKAGVLDFLEKTISTEEKVKVLRKYCKQFRQHYEALTPKSLSKKYKKALDKIKMIGQTEEMYKVAETILLSAKYDSNVLITGETGTGKELAAKAIHYNSDRKHKPFTVINCGVIPEKLIESELFGHAKGSFTGAINDKKGKFLEASGGTVFLDEIGDMPFDIQVKLLRVLQEGVIEPIGKRSIPVDVRIVAATHVNIEKLIKEKQFREDLYFRLNVLRISLPPLRNRKDDIELLLLHFAKKHFKELKTFSKPLVEKLKNYDWPGNVRQLENITQRLNVKTHNSSLIKPEHLDDDFFQTNTSNSNEVKLDVEDFKTIEELSKYTKYCEKVFWESKLKLSENACELAKAFKIPKSSFYRKLSALEVEYKTV